MTAMAQDTYENARVLGSDLNGTARYVGMGGALEALGADISTISTNPAGIGLFRHSTINVSIGVVSQQDATKFDNLSKTNMSFDQAGFVYSTRSGSNSFLNFAFNYHKSRNFDQLLSAANIMRGASLTKLVWGKSTRESDMNGGYYLDTNSQHEWMGWRDQDSDERAYPYTQLDYLYTNAVTMDDVNDRFHINTYMEAGGYGFNRAHRGWIADYDFNISGNINDRVYLGLTIGLHDVKYKGYSIYSENILDVSSTPRGSHQLNDDRRIDGQGFDVKGGIIFRPIEESPLRFGISVQSPTWYDLTSDNYTVLHNLTDKDYYNYGADKYENSESYKFKYVTPWKFGASVGHTIGKMLAIGASYEFADYSSSSTKMVDGMYDEWCSDRNMDQNTDHVLKGVSTIKAGVEVKPDPALAIRLGYNYVTPMYDKEGFRDLTLDSPGNAYASTADYTNWKATNRITCGIGVKTGDWNIDLAYQYSQTDGKFYPFQSNLTFIDPLDDSIVMNKGAVTDVSNKRHQVLLTLGLTF